MATIPIADVLASERMPVDAQDVVTRVRLVIVGTWGGTRDPDGLRTRFGPAAGFEYVTHFAVPLVYEYEAPEHSTYQCERSFQLPEGFNPFLPPDDVGISDPAAINMSDAAFARDGDPLTYSESTSFLQTRLSYSLGPNALVAGLKLRYALTYSGGIPDINRRALSLAYHFVPEAEPSDERVIALQRYTLEATESIDQPEDLLVYALPDARGEGVNYPDPALARWRTLVANVIGFSGNEHVLRVHEFYPLVLNEALLEDVARANIRLPAANPARVTVRGYVAPDREHTITGWPGGDFTGQVAQHQYDLGKTIVDFEQAGAPVGLPAEAIESARERASATLAAISSANYGLMMGERQ